MLNLPFRSHLVRRLHHGNLAPLAKLPSPYLVIGVMAGVALLTLVTLLLFKIPLTTPLLWLLPLYIGVPLHAAVLTANLSARDSASPAYEILALCLVSDIVLVRSYFWAGVYRIRSVLLTTIMILPTLVLLLLYSYSTFTKAIPDTPTTRHAVFVGLSHPDAASPIHLMTVAILLICILVAAWGFNFLGIASGVLCGLRFRQATIAAILAPALLCIIALAITILFSLSVEYNTWASLIGLMGLASSPYILAWFLLRLACRFCRKLMA